jgi:hypothetical protein
MAPSRDHLIADWHQRLADADGVVAEPASRAAWLRRLRTRLYRFLLSLYGNGDWNAATSVEPAQAEPQAGNFAAADIEPLSGKPAKTDDQIRSVLASVASSQDRRPIRGRLSGEKLAYEWFIVAAQSSNLDVRRCQSLLQHVGLECRLNSRGIDRILEVPGPQRKQAIDILDRYRDQLRFHRTARRFQSHTGIRFVIVAIAIPLAVLFPLLAVSSFTIAVQPDRSSAVRLLTAAWGLISISAAVAF